MDKLDEIHKFKMVGFSIIASMVVILGLGIWFFLEWFNFTRKNFNPTKDEKTIDIQYGYDDTVYVFIPMVIISFLTYLIAGAILVSEDIQVNNKMLIVSVSIISIIVGSILLLNAGVSFQSNSMINKTYSDTAKQSASTELREKTVPYIDNAFTSLVVGIIEISMFIGLMVCYSVLFKKKPVPYIPYRSEDYVGKNYLINDKNKF